MSVKYKETSLAVRVCNILAYSLLGVLTVPIPRDLPYVYLIY
jgi:hypothetical protein